MRLHAIACAFASFWMSWNRHPLTLLLLTPVCALIVFVGWKGGFLDTTLLALTTVLSVDASLESRMVMLKQAQDNGEVDK